MASPTTPQDSTPMPARQFNYPSFSALLEGVVNAANSAAAASSSLHPPVPVLQNLPFEGQFGMSHQEALATVAAAQVQHPAECVNSALIASPYDKPVLSSEKKDSEEKEGKRNSTNHINNSANDITKTPISDGYSWRKYGQKQVKSSESFRSYYRCTYAGCHAKKKVQHADKFRCIVGVDYMGQHNHDPSTKAKEKCLKTHTADAMPVFKIDTDTLSATKNRIDFQPKENNKKLIDSDLSASGVDKQVMLVDDRSEPQKANNCQTANVEEVELGKKPNLEQWAIVQQSVPLREEAGRSNGMNKHSVANVTNGNIAPCGQKRRMKDRARAHFLHLQKTPKDTKVVVHAAGDVGVSADGYRWRKYGQKTVKGNTNPRSYYRCTCAGCPARKHVEKATDNSTATVVTYEGKHDHDKPVPKKRHSSTPNAPQCSSVNATPSPSEITADAAKGSDKIIESARTLISMGIELKSC